MSSVKVVRITQGRVYTLTIPDTVEAFQTMCGCTTFDVTRRYIGTGLYDVYCDDEGLLRNRAVSAVDAASGNPVLVGTLVVSASDDDGTSRSLTSEEIGEVSRCVLTGVTEDGREFPVLVCGREPFDPAEAGARLAGVTE